MATGEAMVIGPAGLDEVIQRLRREGYETWGPVVQDGAISPGPVTGVEDLPAGWHDHQEPGSYRLSRGEDAALFAWAVGPGSWKGRFLPPTQTLGPPSGHPGPEEAGAPIAMIGVRPCELSAMAVVDRVLAGAPVPDPDYRRRRAGTFVAVAECSTPAGTCFCSSMDSGPAAGDGYDLALTELSGSGHRFVVRAGTERGARLIEGLTGARVAGGPDLAERDSVLADARAAMVRSLDARGARDLLARNIDHPRWAQLAERCLACGNCTMVCPTCFCTDVRDTSDLHGAVTRQRLWASCFDVDHSYLHGGPVRRSRASRYRQWITHKLSTWWDQFASPGCVGCGRCITWCPVGIDITEEVAAIASSDGAGAPPGGSRP